jgi:hypothetical protein
VSRREAGPRIAHDRRCRGSHGTGRRRRRWRGRDRLACLERAGRDPSLRAALGGRAQPGRRDRRRVGGHRLRTRHSLPGWLAARGVRAGRQLGSRAAMGSLRDGERDGLPLAGRRGTERHPALVRLDDDRSDLGAGLPSGWPAGRGMLRALPLAHLAGAEGRSRVGRAAGPHLSRRGDPLAGLVRRGLLPGEPFTTSSRPDSPSGSSTGPSPPRSARRFPCSARRGRSAPSPGFPGASTGRGDAGHSGNWDPF